VDTSAALLSVAAEALTALDSEEAVTAVGGGEACLSTPVAASSGRMRRRSTPPAEMSADAIALNHSSRGFTPLHT
jgi:hypothetical protein